MSGLVKNILVLGKCQIALDQEKTIHSFTARPPTCTFLSTCWLEDFHELKICAADCGFLSRAEVLGVGGRLHMSLANCIVWEHFGTKFWALTLTEAVLHSMYALILARASKRGGIFITVALATRLWCQKFILKAIIKLCIARNVGLSSYINALCAEQSGIYCNLYIPLWCGKEQAAYVRRKSIYICFKRLLQ